MFKETLQNILERVDGSTGAMIMGTDGIAVEKLFTPEADDANLDVAAAEFTSLLRSARRTGEDIGLGNLQEMVVSTEAATVVMRLLSPEYFMVLAMRPDGNYGRGRFELRKAELQLSEEFAL